MIKRNEAFPYLKKHYKNFWKGTYYLFLVSAGVVLTDRKSSMWFIVLFAIVSSISFVILLSLFRGYEIRKKNRASLKKIEDTLEIPKGQWDYR